MSELSSPSQSPDGIRPYADHHDDGIVQVSFTLPVRYSRSARLAALEIARRMGLSRTEVVHYQQVTDGYTYLVLYGGFESRVDYDAIRSEAPTRAATLAAASSRLPALADPS